MVTPDEIIRSRRKTLAICIDAQGRLIVRAPLQYAEERISSFLREKEGWIRKKQAAHRATALPLPPENLDGYAFLLLGERTKIQLVGGERIGYDKEGRILYLPAKNAQKRLVKWLKENAERILTKVTAEWATRMGTSYQSITVTSAKSRWGSCSADDALRYTFRLLYCPREIIEYVVVHELAHTRHKNHSSAFWAEVAKYLPDWKGKRKWLKEYYTLMEIF